MNRKMHILVFVSVLAVVLTSCSGLAMPKKVSVKTDASYEFSLGSADLTEQVKELAGPDAIGEKLKGALPEGSNSFVYEVDSNNLEYVLRYSILEKDFGNISSLTGGMDPANLFSDIDLSSFEFNQNITIPSISKSIEYNVSKDVISSNIDEKIGNVSIDNINISDVSETGLDSYVEIDSLPSVTVSFSGCDAILYKKGANLSLTVQKTDANVIGDNFKLEVQAYISEDTEGKYTTNRIESGFVDVTNGGTITLPLRGSNTTGLEPGFTVNFQARTSGGVTGTSHAYSVSGSVSSEIEKIFGLKNFSFPMEINNSIDLSSVDMGILKEATIGGASKVSIKTKLPSVWASLNGEDKMSFSLTGFELNGIGLSITGLDSESDSGYALYEKKTLVGQKIIPSLNSADQKISVKGKINLNIGSEGIDLDLTNLPNSISSEIDFVIEKFSDVSINASKFIENGKIEAQVEIPQELKDTVKSISFGSSEGKKHSSVSAEDTACKGFGITFDATNSFAAGSDIPLNVTLKPFNMNKDVSIESGFNNETVNCTDHFKYDFVGNETNFEFAVTIGNSGVITLKDVVPGKAYTFGIKNLKLVSDWDYVDIKKSSVIGEAQGFSGDMDISSFNIAAMTEDLDDEKKDALEKLSLKELPIFFYASMPTVSEGSLISRFLSGDNSFTGKIYIENTDNSYINLIGDKNTSKSIPLVSVSWPNEGEKISTSSKLYSKNMKLVSEGQDHPDYSVGYDFKDLLKGEMSKIVYDISLTSDNSDAASAVRIYSFDFDSNNSESAVLAIEAAIKIPMAFEITDDIELSFDDFVGETDLFGRTGPESASELSDYISIIENMSIHYSIRNKVIPGFSGKCEIIFYEGTDHEIRKAVSFIDGNQVLSLSNSEIDVILNNYPLVPNLKICIPKGQYSMNKAAINSGNAFSVSSKIKVKSNGEPVTIWESGNGGAK